MQTQYLLAIGQERLNPVMIVDSLHNIANHFNIEKGDREFH